MSKLQPGSLPAFVIGAIGVVGELVLLRHSLVDSYPFKLLEYPPWQFYRQLGNLGSVVILIVTALLAVAVARKSAHLVPLVATTFAPLSYVVLLTIATSVFHGWKVPPGTANYDGYTVGKATIEFMVTASYLAVGGLVVGGICSGVLWSWVKRGGATVP